MTATAIKILHDKLQASYDRSKMAETQQNYVPLLEEFCEILCTSDDTTLKDSINEISAIGYREQERSIQLQKKCSSDTKTCMSKIMTYAKKNKINMPSLLGCFQEYEDLKEKRIVTSKEEPYDQFQITCRALEILAEDTSKDHGIFLKKFISIDKNKSIEFIFAPEITTWEEEKKYLGRSQKHKVWYSLWKLIRFHELYDFKTRKATNDQFKKNKNFFGSLSFYDDALNFDQALEGKTGIDIEEYKIHQNRVWEFIKPMLLKHKEKTPSELSVSFDSDTGKMTINAYDIPPFKPKSLEARLLFAMSPGGSPCRDPMPLDEIVDHMLDKENAKKPDKDKIYKARDRINQKIKEATGIEDLLIADETRNGYMVWNPLYTYIY